MQLLLNNRLPLPIAILTVACLFCMTPKIVLAQKNQPMVREHWRAQIRDGRTMEAIQLAKELIEYTNSKYPSVSIRAYIEKSGEVTTFHSFADYEDMTSFKRINLQFGQDQRWMTMWQKVHAFIVEKAPFSKLY